MATCASISVINEDKHYKTIYVHFDGYIDGLGNTLYNFYKDEEKVNELINLGDASSIDETIESSEFYQRDRGEVGCGPVYYFSLHGFEKKFEYSYVFKEGEWFLVQSGKLEPLKEFLRTKTKIN